MEESLGFGGGTLGLLLTSFLLFALSLAGAGEDLWMPAITMLTIGALFGTGVTVGTRLAAHRDATNFDEALERIRNLAPPNQQHQRSPPQPANPQSH